MKKRILLIISIFVVVLILFSSSYALLFKSNQTDKQEYTTGMLEITSETLSGSVTLNNPLPMSDSDGENTTPYVFRITNTGNLTYKFNIMLLSTTTNNQISSNYIKLKVNTDTPVKLNSLTDGIILSNITLKPGKSIDVTLRVWLSEDTPNTEIGKTFNAKITTEGEAIYTTDPAKETLTNLGLTVSSGTPDFSKTSCSSGCDESTVGIYEAEDDIGTSYYFRGDVENNYVYFAGFYWRIIRINGDGSVRMIYAGTIARDNGYNGSDINAMNIGSSTFNTSYTDNAYVGFMYGTTGSSSYDLTHTNTNDSTIKGVLDTWYNSNIKNTRNEQYVVDAIYCNDKEVSTSNSLGYTGSGTAKEKTTYKAFERLYDNKTPTLKCSQTNDRFTVNDSINAVAGNGTLTNPIGLITADEMYYAGDIYNANNSKYYLYAGSDYWTMTPSHYQVGAYLFVVNDPLKTADTSRTMVRPVISISGIALNAGTGAKTDPFKIDAAKNTLTQLGLTENTDTPDFSKTSCSSGCEESTVGIYKTQDDLGTSYYFRGNVENNYVYFANYYWRIIRINGDGSIRMIYDGTSAHDNGESTDDRLIGTTIFNDRNSNAYVGYKYGSSTATTYEETHKNTTDSTIKRVVDSWYKTNILDKGFSSYLVDSIYCNDRSLSSGTGISQNITYYKADERLYTNKTPTFSCTQSNDKFTVNANEGNGSLQYPVGLITADEIVYSGVAFQEVNNSSYLSIGLGYFTMTPAFFHVQAGASSYKLSSENKIASDSANNADGVRPVISISGTVLSSGTGTKATPFKIG